MRITVVGSGAIGGTAGAYLARAGHTVLFCDAAADHVAAMRAKGLTIRAWDEEFCIAAPAVTPDDLAGPLDLVLLAVKAQHTRAAMQTIAPLLAEAGVVVSLQNGLNEQVIAEHIGPQRTVGALVNFSADYLEPGLIAYGGPGVFMLGELDGQITPRLEKLRDLLSAWGEIELTRNIWGCLWGKLGYANMLYATALVDASMAEAIDRYRPLMVALAAEVYAVSHALGIEPEPFDAVEPRLYFPPEGRDPAAIDRSLDTLVERRRRDKKTRSGVWRDLAVRKRRTEVEEHLLPIIRHGEGAGLALPLTRRVAERIHDLEEGRAEMSWRHLDELEALRTETDDA
jgi:2-dehydropantoate 2-reductase